MNSLTVLIKNIDPNPLSFTSLCDLVVDPDNAKRVIYAVEDADITDIPSLAIISVALTHKGHRELAKTFLSDSINRHSGEDTTLLIILLAFANLQSAASGAQAEEAKAEASRLFQQAIGNGSKVPLYWLGCSLNMLISKDFVQASDNLGIARQTRANLDVSAHSYNLFNLDPLIFFTSALIHYQKENYEAASRDFNYLVFIAANSIPMARLGLGMSYYHLNRNTDAINAFESVLFIDPKNMIALTYLGLIHYRSGDKKGKELFVKYISLSRDIEKDIPDEQKSAVSHALYMIIRHWDLEKKFPELVDKTPDQIFSDLKKILKKLVSLSKVCDDHVVSAESFFQFARIHHISHKFEKAKTYYLRAIGLNPDHQLARLGLSRLVLSEGKPEEAISYLNGGAILPESYESRTILGFAHATLYRQSNKESDKISAIQNLSEALRLITAFNIQSKELPSIYLTLGWLRLKELKFSEAEHLFSNVSQESDQLFTYWGITLYQLGKHTEALQKFQLVNTKTPVLQYNIAMCYEQLDETEKSKEIYQELVEQYPTFSMPYIRLGALEEKENKYDMAIKHYQSCIQFTGGSSWANIALGGVYQKIMRPQAAIDSYESIRKDPNQKDAFLTSYVSCGNIFLERAQEKKDVAEKLKRIDRSIELFRKALQHNSHCIAAANGLAICWIHRGAIDAATDKLLLIKEERPEFPSSYLNLAFAVMSSKAKTTDQILNMFTRAMALIEEANRKHFENTNIQIWYHYYDAAKNAYKFEESLTAAEQIVALDPRVTAHWEWLSSSLYKALAFRTNPRNVQLHKPSLSTVKKWLRQANRCLQLYAKIDEVKGSNEGSHAKKVEDIQKTIIPSIHKLIADIEREHNRSRETFQDRLVFRGDFSDSEDENEARVR